MDPLYEKQIKKFCRGSFQSILSPAVHQSVYSLHPKTDPLYMKLEN